MAKLSGPSLTRAVDWKIFEIQSRLVGEDTVEADVNDCIAWFQSRHYNEVIEERAADSRCGYPLCNKSLTVHANQQYRINYSDKEIYKVENSIYYCSSNCLMKSVTLEKALSTEMPSSRAISRSLDTNSVKGNIDDLLGLFDGVGPSKSTKPTTSSTPEKTDEPLPQYYNAKVSDDGRLVSAVVSEKADKQSIPTKVAPLTTKEAKEMLAKCDTSTDTTPTKQKKTTPTFTPKTPTAANSVNNAKREIIADASAASAATADLSMDEILNKMKAIREGSSTSNSTKPSPIKPVSAVANRADDDDESDDGDNSTNKSSAKSGGTSSNNKREQPWTEPIPGAKSKSVKWQDTAGDSPAKSIGGGGGSSGSSTPNKASPATNRVVSESVTKMKVMEKPPASAAVVNGSGMKPKPSIMSKLGSVMERTNPQPMSLGAMMLKQETGVVSSGISAAAKPTNSSSAGAVNPSDEAAFSIEGYVSEMRSSMRVAPITTIKNLSYDPWQRYATNTTSAVSENEVPVVEELVDGDDSTTRKQQSADEAGTDNDISDGENDDEEQDDDDVDDTGTDDEPAISLFLQVWTALDDLFSHVRMEDDEMATFNAPPPPAPSVGASSSGTGGESRVPVAAEFLQVQSAVLKLLERGIKSAEKLLDVPKYVITKADINVYYITKTRFLNSVNCRLIKCPSLKSTGWTLIGILLIDGILTRKSLLSDAYRGTVWTSIVDSMAAAALGGGHIAGSQLRMDDLKILRSFFTDL